jgi:hypothetical protein
VDDHSEPTERHLPEVPAEPLSDSARADFVTAPGHFSWPPAGSSLTAYGQNLMTADTLQMPWNPYQTRMTIPSIEEGRLGRSGGRALVPTT